MRPLVLAIALAGCGRVFGLEHVDLPDGGDPASTITVIPTFEITETDGTGAFVHREVVLPATFVASVDGTDVPVAIDPATGIATFDVPIGATYALVFDDSLEYDDRAETFYLASPYIGRFGVTPVTQPTPVDLLLTQPLDSGPVRELIATTGMRSSTVLFGPAVDLETDTKVSFDTQALRPVGGVPGLLEGTRGDRLWYLRQSRFDGSGLQRSAYITLTSGTNQIDQQDGVASVAAITASTMVLSKCIGYAIPLAVEEARIAGTFAPASWATLPADFWQLGSVPINTEGPYGALELARLDPTLHGVDDQGQLCYANPFPGETEVMTVAAITFVRPTRSGANPGGYTGAGTIYQFPILGTAVAVGDPIAMPGPATLAGMPLVDNTTLAVDRTHPIELAFAPTATAGTVAIDDYLVALYELAVDPNNTTVATEVFVWSVLAPRVSIDPRRLVAGKHYAFQLIARAGFPGAAVRDYRRTGYPTATAIAWTADFSVD